MENRDKKWEGKSQEEKPQQYKTDEHKTDEHKTDEEVDNTTVNTDKTSTDKTSTDKTSTDKTGTDKTSTDKTGTDKQEPRHHYVPKKTLERFGIHRSEAWGQNVMESLDRLHEDKADIIASMIEFMGETGVNYGIIPVVVAGSEEYSDFVCNAERFFFSIGYIMGRHEGETEVEFEKSQEKE